MKDADTHLLHVTSPNSDAGRDYAAGTKIHESGQNIEAHSAAQKTSPVTPHEKRLHDNKPAG